VLNTARASSGRFSPRRPGASPFGRFPPWHIRRRGRIYELVRLYPDYLAIDLADRCDLIPKLVPSRRHPERRFKIDGQPEVAGPGV